MKQLIQSIKEGNLTVAEVPAPLARAGGVLVRTRASLVSAGTERMVVDFAEKNLLQKARSRPDLVRQTMDKAKREGVLTTLEAVQNKLDQPMSLGYSCAGEVIDVGAGVTRFKIGDRVACAGGGYAVHAEVIAVPQNLVVPIAEHVTDDAAAFVTLGAIALQGIRLAEPKLGETVAVIGLGLLGQLTVQMLRAAGCRVVGIDLQSARAELALRSGAHAAVTSSEEFVIACQQYSGGHGADAVLITADTKSSQPLELAGEASRDKGVVVAVGAVGMTIPRKVFFEKELDFRISRSYGPGRYDTEYEEKGRDYPYGYVRWTEGRNLEAFVAMIAESQVDVASLISHRFPVDDAAQAYDLITGKRDEPFLGVVLTYPEAPSMNRKIVLHDSATQAAKFASGGQSHALAAVQLGVIGGGNFANATLLPAIKNVPEIKLVGIASGSGLSARSTADRFKFDYCTTETAQVFADPAVNTVAILTRHDLHARQVVAALAAGKHVFVEKPLCLTESELDEVVAAYSDAKPVEGHEATNNSSAPMVMVGFNRRFAPFVSELKKHLASVKEPLMMTYRVNAGFIPLDHWTQDEVLGGGRLRGEGCHFIDLLCSLASAKPRRVTTRVLPDANRYAQDNFQVTIEFADGTLGTVVYTANGDKGFPKEYLEVFGGGLAARMDDYRSLSIRQGTTRVDRAARLRQDKGHRAEWQAIAAHLTGKASAPISFDALVLSTRATLAAYRSLQSGEPEIVGASK
jgi:predicted dehydrogenase/threonine dehydrogenase-like Zn-dependent dehydrogenase